VIGPARVVERGRQACYTQPMRTLLCVVALAACSGTPKKAGGDGSGTGSAPPPPAAQTLLAFAASAYDAQTQPQSKLYLEVTDHNGSMQSYPLGEVGAPCERAAGNGSDIIAGMRCDVAGTGAELRAVFRGTTEIIVLRRNYTPEDDPADLEMSFREVLRVPVPPGSNVKPAG
jgi:hypothetical protein